MQALGHAVKMLSAIDLGALNSQFGKKSETPFVCKQIESTNTSLQAIGLNPSCSGQAYFNRPDMGHGYKSTEPGCISTVGETGSGCPLSWLSHLIF